MDQIITSALFAIVASGLLIAGIANGDHGETAAGATLLILTIGAYFFGVAERRRGNAA